MHNHQPSAACFRSPTFFVSIGLFILDACPEALHRITSPRPSLRLSLAVYFQRSPSPSRVRLSALSPLSYNLASPSRLDTQTPFAGYSSVSSCILLLFCLISCALHPPSPLGSIIADPNHGLAVSPFFDHFLLLRVMSFPRIFTRFRLSSTYFGFTPDDVRLPLSGAGFRTHFSCTCPLQLPLPASVQRLTLPRGI